MKPSTPHKEIPLPSGTGHRRASVTIKNEDKPCEVKISYALISLEEQVFILKKICGVDVDISHVWTLNAKTRKDQDSIALAFALEWLGLSVRKEQAP